MAQHATLLRHAPQEEQIACAQRLMR